MADLFLRLSISWRGRQAYASLMPHILCCRYPLRVTMVMGLGLLIHSTYGSSMPPITSSPLLMACGDSDGCTWAPSSTDYLCSELGVLFLLAADTGFTISKLSEVKVRNLKPSCRFGMSMENGMAITDG
ncbi:hypothetical protein Tco_0869850 [Tanacetum coccineum]